jgi:hypothetical protein
MVNITKFFFLWYRARFNLEVLGWRLIKTESEKRLNLRELSPSDPSLPELTPSFRNEWKWINDAVNITKSFL